MSHRLQDAQRALADAEALRAAAQEREAAVADERERHAAEAEGLRAALAEAQGAARRLEAERDAARAEGAAAAGRAERADARGAEHRLADVQASPLLNPFYWSVVPLKSCFLQFPAIPGVLEQAHSRKATDHLGKGASSPVALICSAKDIPFVSLSAIIPAELQACSRRAAQAELMAAQYDAQAAAEQLGAARERASDLEHHLGDARDALARAEARAASAEEQVGTRP